MLIFVYAKCRFAIRTVGEGRACYTIAIGSKEKARSRWAIALEL